MLSDEILKEATADVVRFRLSQYPEEEMLHTFSKAFEKRMKKIIKRADHPVRHHIMRVAAILVITITVLFGALLAASPEVRAGTLDWIREDLGGFIHYENGGSTAEQGEAPLYDYYLSVVPEGYKEDSVYAGSHYKDYSYMREDGKILAFMYLYNSEGAGVQISTLNHDYRTGYVHDCPAELYLSRDGKHPGYIIWQDPKTKAMLLIQAFMDGEELIAVAETVVRAEKEKQTIE